MAHFNFGTSFDYPCLGTLKVIVMKDFTKAEKVAIRYLFEWAQQGDVDFPDSIITAYFNLVSGTISEKTKAAHKLCNHMEGFLSQEKSKQIKQELLSCIA